MPKRRPDESLPPVQFSEVTGLDDVMQPRQPGQSRVVVAGLVGLVLLIIAVGLIQRQLPFLSYTAVTVTTSTNSTTGNQQSGRPIQIQTNINYGVLLNGNPVQAAPGVTFQLLKNVNRLSLKAPPFLSFACTITWPPTEGGNNCPLNGTTSDPNTGDTVYIIAFQPGIDDLPADQRAQVSNLILSTTQNALQIHLQVPAGDYYPYGYAANGLPLSRRASATFTATLRADALAPNTCGATICPDTSPIIQTYQAPAIDFSIMPTYVWHFATGSASIGTFSLTDPAITVQTGMTQPLTIGLTYDPNQGWQAVAPPGQTVASELQDESVGSICFMSTVAITQAISQTKNSDTGFALFPHQNMQGCQIDVFGTDPNHPDGSFLVRFGAVLAADAGGHKLLPQLPMAPKDEIQIVESSG